MDLNGSQCTPCVNDLLVRAGADHPLTLLAMGLRLADERPPRSRIDSLEEALEQQPDSEWLREEAIRVYCTQERMDDPRRLEHVVEYVRRFPRSAFAHCPFAYVPTEDNPAGFRRIEREWLRHVQDHPQDPEIARGFALFIAWHDPERALAVLRAVLEDSPKNADIWLEMGRISRVPSERQHFFEEARRLGATQPNLLVWIAVAALDAGDLGAAERAAREVLFLISAARATHGERLDWPERGVALWKRAEAACMDDATTRELVRAIRDHSSTHSDRQGRIGSGAVAELIKVYSRLLLRRVAQPLATQWAPK